MSAEGVRELCFINAVMNSHTTVWWNTKTWKKMLPSPHSLHYWDFFQHDNEDIHSPKVKIFQWTCISLSLNALEQLWGILWRRAEQNSPLKTRAYMCKYVCVCARVCVCVCVHIYVHLIIIFIKESWKKMYHGFHKNIKQHNIIKYSWTPNQHLRMISEGSCDTEDWSNDGKNSALGNNRNKLHFIL